MRFLDFCAKTPVILASFIGTILIGWGFGIFQHHVGGPLLDEQFSTADALRRLGEMTEAQQNAHIWITLSLDSLYPLANFMLLVGIAWRLGGRRRGWLALPALIYVLSDFGENMLEVMALRGSTGFLDIKTVLTMIKFGSISAAFIIAIALLLYAGFKKIRR